ncbi:glycosyltransferase family 2 protein [Bdellovibrio bacteriovorus]|nr:glycosyltransferase family 2 protein [Bdellovibrio bacteriovorus]
MSSSCYLSIVVPVFNEQECIQEFIDQVTIQMNLIEKSCELVFVDDGSMDRTVSIIRTNISRDSRIGLIEFSYNHGKPMALTAGMQFCRGEYVLMMDPDLQDPPEAICSFLTEILQGYDVVYGIRKEKADTFLRKIFSSVFWWILDRFTGISLPRGIAAMRIMSRRFVDTFLLYKETNRFIEGLFSHVGLKQGTLLIDNRRRFAGVSKFNFKRRLDLALNAIFDYSDLPLKITIRFGLIVTGVGLFAAFGLVIAKLAYVEFQIGWPSVMTTLVVGFGMQIFFMGLIGTYLGRIYKEVKNRPLYSIRDRVNI